LATAIRLAAAGRRVVVLERNDVTGGKLATRHHDGCTFDLGPSLLTLPHVFDELFRVAGTTLAAEVDLVRLDPQFRYWWPDGASLVVPDDPTATAAAFDAFSPGAGAAWRRFDERGRRIWDVSARSFFAGPMSGPVGLLRRMRSPRDLLTIDPLRSLHARAAEHFADPRLVQWAGRYATYSGSSPYRAPATLACIPHLESRYGCWYPVGGLDALRAALQRAAESLGVEVRTATDVVRVSVRDGTVTGVETAEGSSVASPVVVANADAEHLYGELLPDANALRRVRRAERSTSGFVLTVAVDGRTPGIGHHNVWFAGDPRAEFAEREAGRMAGDPTIYACVSAVTDPSQAPAGGENWFLLLNAPAGVELDGELEGRVLLDQLAARGVDLRRRVVGTSTMTPIDMAARYRAPGGAIYGTSSNGRRAAFLRPGNRGSVRGLYLVGGSSHPGCGLPLVAMSARIVADMVAADGSPQ
ncbi:MAG: phytoene desaturase family protein, partial [Ilumatobacteraceae bacterium]